VPRSDDSDGTVSPAGETRTREPGRVSAKVPAPRSAADTPVAKKAHRVPVAHSNAEALRRRGPTKRQAKGRGIQPRARHLDWFDFGTYILSSRYATLNLVMILLASAAVVAAFALGILVIDSRTNPGFTVGLTSAATVAVTTIAGARTIKRRNQRRSGLKPNEDPAQEGSVPDGPPGD
jgi:hypothetical protein